MDLLAFERETEVATFFRYTSGNDIECYWSSTGAGGIWGWTGKASETSPGPRKFFASDVALKNPFNTATFRVLGARAAQPNQAGMYRLGDRYFGPGSTTWRVSTEGGIKDADWSATNFSAGDVVRTSAGRYYRNKTFATSTVEPTHTSGTVTVGGATWTYLTNADAAFTLVQDIVKQTSAYTTSNVATDRAFDANATTLDEVADVLGTLIADLKL